MTHSTTVPGRTPLLSNQTYNVLKWIALVAIPALGLLYFGLAEIWGLPNAAQVMATTTAVDTFLGALLGLSTKRYNQSDAKFDGALIVDKSNPEKDLYSFNFDKPLDQITESDSVTFKIDTSKNPEDTSS